MKEVDDLMGELSVALGEVIDRTVLHKNLVDAFIALRKDTTEMELIRKRMEQLEGLAKRLKLTIVEGQVKVVANPSDSQVMTVLRAGCYWHESMDVESVFLASLVT